MRENLLAFWRNVSLVMTARYFSWKQWCQIMKLAVIYQQVDQALALLRRKSGLKCVPGCGKCCRHVYAEVSMLEMMPLASVLLRRKRVDLWLKKLSSLPEEGRCIFYQGNPAVNTNGRCRIYPLRPLICRLFGFAARKKKNGAQILICARMKEFYPIETAQANNLAQQGQNVTYVDRRREQLAQIDESGGRVLGSLPHVLYKAIMRLGLYQQMKR